MSRRLAQLGIVGLAAVAGFSASACQAPDDQVRSYSGPNLNLLVMGYTHACNDGRSSPTGGLVISAGPFLADAEVRLHWSVGVRGLYGTWPPADAARTGDFRTRVKLPEKVLSPGDKVQIWAQGAGPEGIAAYRGRARIGNC